MPDNADTRPLPEDWVQEYDQRRQKWFYKNVFAASPRISHSRPFKSVISILRTTPILNPKRNPQAAAPASPSEGQDSVHVRQLYENLPTALPPVPIPPPAPNLPTHMRRSWTTDMFPMPATYLPDVLDRPRTPDGRLSPGAFSTLSPTAPNTPSGAWTYMRSSSPGSPASRALPPIPLQTPPRSPHRRVSTTDVPAAPALSVHPSVQRQARSQSVSHTGMPFLAPPWPHSPPPQLIPHNREPVYQPTCFDPVPQLPIDVFAEPPRSALHHRVTSRSDPIGLHCPSSPHGQLQQPTSYSQHLRPPTPEYQQTTFESLPHELDAYPPQQLEYVPPEDTSLVYPPPPDVVDLALQTSPKLDNPYERGFYEGCSSTREGVYQEISGGGDDEAVPGGGVYGMVPSYDPSTETGFYNALGPTAEQNAMDMGLGVVVGAEGTTFSTFSTMTRGSHELQTGYGEHEYVDDRMDRAPPYEPGFEARMYV